MGQEIEEIFCSCGDTPQETEVTSAEHRQYGCLTLGCCVTAYKCPNCATRWLITFEAPDPRW